MTPSPNTHLRDRIAACKGLTTVQISERLTGFELDDITKELMLMCMERSDTSLFNFVPLTIRQTMYGDDDISDWILHYDDAGGTTITEADEDTKLDAHVRWERWEDCVRLINDDVQAMSLFYALRAIALGEEGFRSNGRWWFMGVNFTGDNDPNRPGRLIAYLRGKVWGEDDELNSYVDEVGLNNLLAARAKVLGHTMADLGAAETLAGSWLRWEISEHDDMSQIDFGSGGEWTFRMVNRTQAKDIPNDKGVTTRFTTTKAFLYAAGGREDLPTQLVSGSAKLLGTDDNLAAFNAATRKMYSPGALAGN